ncbi:MAG: OsmC family protein [Acidimicrobiia bacterium]
MTILDAVDSVRTVLEKDPARAVVRIRAEARLEEGTVAAVRAGAHSLTVDEPKSVGGTGTGPNPVQMVLSSLASCQAISYRYWSELLGIRLDAITVRVEGDIDQRGFLGFAEGVPAGTTAVRCTVTVEGPETPERYEELRRSVDAHCPVLDVFTMALAVERHLEIGTPAERLGQGPPAAPR